MLHASEVEHKAFEQESFTQDLAVSRGPQPGACVQTIWTVIISAVPTVGKNNQQILSAMVKQIKTYKKVFDKFCTTARLEATLLVHVQVSL